MGEKLHEDFITSDLCRGGKSNQYNTLWAHHRSALVNWLDNFAVSVKWLLLCVMQSVCLVSCDLADIQHNTRVQLLTDLTDDVEELEAQMNQ